MEGGYGEQVEDQGQRSRAQRDREPGHAAPVRPAQRVAPARAALRLRSGAVWCLLGAAGRQGDSVVCDAGGRGQRQGDHDARGPTGSVGKGARDRCCIAGAAPVAAGVDRRAGAALRLLPERDDDPGRRFAVDDEEPDRGSDPHRDERPSLPLWHLSAHPDGDQAGRRRDGEGRQVTMTGFLHEKEFSRKNFLKGSGALVVGFSLLGSGLAAKASAAGPQATGYLPDPSQVDSWISVLADNTVVFKTSQIECGNGVTTGLCQLVAEEMNLPAGSVHHIAWDSWNMVNSGST